jgi:hypothetical protein
MDFIAASKKAVQYPITKYPALRMEEYLPNTKINKVNAN